MGEAVDRLMRDCRRCRLPLPGIPQPQRRQSLPRTPDSPMPRLAICAARVPRAWRSLALLIFVVFAPSCGGSAGPTAPSGGGGNPPVTPTPVVTALAVTPTPVALKIGESQQLTAIPRDANGNAITGRT